MAKNFTRENSIVIHPTATKLRFGRSSDSEPVIIDHCIARKIKNGSRSVRQPMIPDNRLSTLLNPKLNNTIKLASIAIKSSSMDQLKSFKEQPTINELMQLNKQHFKSESEKISDYQMNYSKMKETLIGEDALNLPQSSPYSISWPFWDDKLSDKYSKSAVIQDLEDIWSMAIEKWLKISRFDLRFYNVILVIPDLIIRSEIRWIVDMLLLELEFANIVLQQENVCVTYSTGLPTACVVNIHDNSVSISCIEEGISIPEGRIKLSYGTGDALCLFHSLLLRIGLPKTEVESYTDYQGVLALQRLLQSASDLQQLPAKDDLLKSPARKLTGKRMLFDGEHVVTRSWELFVSMENIFSALSLFYPSLICKDGSKFQLQHNLSDESEPDDPFDDLYLTLTSRERKKQRFDDGPGGNGVGGSAQNTIDDLLDDEDNFIARTSNSGRTNNLIPESPSSNLQNDTSRALPLNDAVVRSINRSLNSLLVPIDNVGETSKQLCTVILAGEFMGFSGFVEWLQNSLAQSLSQCGEVEVIHNDFTDGVAAHSAAWKGATMITLVGYCDDLWISVNDWKKYGSRAIREKAPFLW